MSVVANIPTIKQARDAGLPFYQLIISSWGERGAAITGEDNAFVLDVPVRWMAMDPGSDVESLLVQYDNAFPGNVVTINPFLGIEQTNQVIMSVDRPFMDKMPAPFSVRAALPSFYTDTYRTELGVTAPFGSVLSTTNQVAESVASGVFVLPTLRVLLGFEEPPSVSTKRFTKLYRVFRDAAGPDELLYVVPVFGRKRARVTFFIPTAADWDVRVTAVSGTVFQPVAGAQVPFLQEFSLGTPSTLTNVAGPAELTFQLKDFDANFLLIKGTKNGGSALTLHVSVAD